MIFVNCQLLNSCTRKIPPAHAGPLEKKEEGRRAAQEGPHSGKHFNRPMSKAHQGPQWKTFTSQTHQGSQLKNVSQVHQGSRGKNMSLAV